MTRLIRFVRLMWRYSTSIDAYTHMRIDPNRLPSVPAANAIGITLCPGNRTKCRWESDPREDLVRRCNSCGAADFLVRNPYVDVNGSPPYHWVRRFDPQG